MLDVAKVIRRSNNGKFDTVVFFDKSAEGVAETQKNIPGAIGFPGDFPKVVLLDDVDEDNVVDTGEELRADTADRDTAETHSHQMLIAQRRQFIRQFPFDVINLDLEEFLLKPNDPLPGRVVNALRKILGWQRRLIPNGGGECVDCFCLMFTTQIGPPNLSADYLGMLENYLARNIEDDPALGELLRVRTGIGDPTGLRMSNFAEFFRLAMPKVLAQSFRTEDWYVDPDRGISMYEFERNSSSGPYKMLHLVMDVRRQRPRSDQRPPGAEGTGVRTAYQAVVRQLFTQREIVVSDGTIEKVHLQQDLEKIFSRRKKYLEG
jgi:hypothetical protein